MKHVIGSQCPAPLVVVVFARSSNPSSVGKVPRKMDSIMASATAMYSASVVDEDSVRCFCNSHEIAAPASM